MVSLHSHRSSPDCHGSSMTETSLTVHWTLDKSDPVHNIVDHISIPLLAFLLICFIFRFSFGIFPSFGFSLILFRLAFLPLIVFFPFCPSIFSCHSCLSLFYPFVLLVSSFHRVSLSVISCYLFYSFIFFSLRFLLSCPSGSLYTLFNPVPHL